MNIYEVKNNTSLYRNKKKFLAATKIWKVEIKLQKKRNKVYKIQYLVMLNGKSIFLIPNLQLSREQSYDKLLIMLKIHV